MILRHTAGPRASAGRTSANRTLTLALAGLVLGAVFLASAGPAQAWWGDFFDGDASGQAIFEDSFIHAEALHADGVTYVAYQGKFLDPYVVSYVHASKKWHGPYKVGENLLAGGYDPDDTHGAPSMLMDDAGYLHVFWGGHGSPIRHARSLRASDPDPSSWTPSAQITGAATYPQVFRTDDGVTHLFYRNGDASLPTAYHGWVESTSTGAASRWSKPKAVVVGDALTNWYARFSPGGSGRVHAAMVAYDQKANNPYQRHRVYYMRREPDGSWVNARGAPVTASRGVTPDKADLDATAVVYASKEESQNEVISSEDASGNPGVLFLTGSGASFRYVFARWLPESSSWSTATITETDHFMDSGTAIEDGPGHVTAYLTTPGSGGPAPGSDPYRDRGGDIERWQSGDGGASWTKVGKVMTSTDPLLVYNDPQPVRTVTGTASPEARLVFCEWDNDATNFFHKVYLAGDDGFAQKQFTPRITRLAGRDRYATSVEVSKRSYPVSADKAVIVSGEVFTDALAAAPLAQAYNAPVLLSQHGRVPPSVLAELRRLKVKTVYVVGGLATLNLTVTKTLSALPGVSTVTRISGSDRFDLARTLSRSVSSKRGRPHSVVVVNGYRFADALSISALAAYKGWPILLTDTGRTPAATRLALGSLQPSETIVVGGTDSVSATQAATFPSPVRLGGADRYQVSAGVAEFSFARGLKVDRVAVTSGEVFSDALSAGPMMARARGPLLLAPRDGLTSEVGAFLDRRGDKVLDAYLTGGTVWLPPAVADDLNEVLQIDPVR